MATYTAPTTRTTGALISASIWNTDIVENLKYFKDAPVFDGDISVGDDIFLTSTGAVINFASGDVTITHSTNTLTFGGAASGYIFNDGNVGIGVTPTGSLHVERAGVNNIISAIGQTGYEGVLYLSGDGSGKDTAVVIGNGRSLNFKTTATATPTASGTTRMTLTDSGNLGIGVTPGSVKLDIVGLTDAVRVASNTTNATTKEGKFLIRHYTNSEEDFLLAYGYSTATDNGIAFGGGSASQNAATLISFYTAANTTTVAGTEAMRVNAGQELLIGYTADNGAYKLQVNSQIFATNATIATSDGRFKTDVQPVREGLAAVKALQPVQFRWKKHPVHNFIDGTDVGFIAQDVRAALTGRDYTGAVVTQNGSGESEFLGMADSKLIPLLVAAVQELDAKISALCAQ